MKLKKGVEIQGIRPELILGLIVADGVYDEIDEEMVVTSLLDGRHSRKSLHYSGCGADLRTRNLTMFQLPIVEQNLINSLPDDFDVVVEENHIHIEYDPKFKR